MDAVALVANACCRSLLCFGGGLAGVEKRLISANEKKWHSDMSVLLGVANVAQHQQHRKQRYCSCEFVGWPTFVPSATSCEPRNDANWIKERPHCCQTGRRRDDYDRFFWSP